MYVYIQSEFAGRDYAEHNLFTVGFYAPDGKWHPESDYNDREQAAQRVAWLNGSKAKHEGPVA